MTACVFCRIALVLAGTETALVVDRLLDIRSELTAKVGSR